MYRLSAQFHSEKDTSGHRVFNRIRFTASRGKDAVRVIDLDVAANGIDATIIVLLAGSDPETAIRANQALKCGEIVDLGMHDADALTELGFDML
jgi:hypothetical protein